MSGRIDTAAWMAPDAAGPVIAALAAEGGPSAARFVGGCVRNAVMGLDADDIDIATTLTPDQVTRALQSAGLKAVPTGIDHGTVTAVHRGRPFEVTTLRRDVETDGRRAVVAFTEDWAQDAQRRDFRLNAIYADSDGGLLDPTGHGVADAQAGRIVFVGEPEQRIREDYLRMLRFFRFLAWYGRGEPDAAGLAACADLRELLRDRPGERVSKELLKLLAADEPRPAVRLMEQTGVLAVALPAAGLLDRFESLVAIERATGECDPLLRLAALLAPGAPSALATSAALRLSGVQRDRLVAAEGTEPPLTAGMDLADARRVIYRLGAGAFRDRARLAQAGDGETDRWGPLLAGTAEWTPPPFPLTGADVLQAGLAAGPLVGDVLQSVETWWMERDFQPDREALLRQLRSRLTRS